MRRLQGFEEAATFTPAPVNLLTETHTHDKNESSAHNTRFTPPVTDTMSRPLLDSDDSSQPWSGADEAKTGSDLESHVINESSSRIHHDSSLQQHSRKLADVPIGSPPEELDPFRRFKERKACADSLSAGWNPNYPPQTADVAAYMRRVAGKGVLDIIRGAAQALG